MIVVPIVFDVVTVPADAVALAVTAAALAEGADASPVAVAVTVSVSANKEVLGVHVVVYSCLAAGGAVSKEIGLRHVAQRSQQRNES